ncbi:hypothetical protein A2625_05030 [candidate division WOR-1 bacterium RIFCSPHIGHO2_01_FULL_53_15]|uniref:Phosphoribosyltransferase domain-containing protein n=1 Tax=candidate division WOR-1 bacterium RIFCSPHIGHO2_01_FULL_53_15 TaxID=1802564 RepID=A0A1F4PZU3_UNCSA|nr:MAG: hypothetical protein A2625_05030 [candidate division WOR-1 bacterium RIFCSPHIGHO2_01_FULL_53_15]OGC10856.1 MAG: hypothetical protein A3D23_05250 [candidate division WOR-1 bacterium RIFCSPHIGHO2_02_FULL_53_26]
MVIHFSQTLGLPPVRTALPRQGMIAGRKNILSVLRDQGRLIKLGEPPAWPIGGRAVLHAKTLADLVRMMERRRTLIYLDDFSAPLAEQFALDPDLALPLRANFIYNKLERAGYLIQLSSAHALEEALRPIQALTDAVRRGRIARIEKTFGVDREILKEKVSKHLLDLRGKQAEEAARGFYAPLITNDEDLLYLEQKVFRYASEQRLIEQTSISGHDQIGVLLALLNLNRTSNAALEPETFRFLLARLCRHQVRAFLDHEKKIEPDNTLIVVPLKAGLFFAEAFRHFGFKNFWHLGVRKSANHVQVDEYFRLPARPVMRPFTVIADPLIATGATIHHILSRKLLPLGVLNIEEVERHHGPQTFFGGNVRILSSFAAPEGIYRIGHAFKGAKFHLGSLEEKLNGGALIQPLGFDIGREAFRGTRWEIERFARLHFISTVEEEIKLLPAILQNLQFSPKLRDIY